MNEIIQNINSIDDITPGSLPGYFFPKLVEMGHLIIEPFSPSSLGNICYYVHFNNLFRRQKEAGELIDTSLADSIEQAFLEYEMLDEIIVQPGESVIAQSYEKIGISPWLLAKMENTSALGRVFVNHASHRFFHPGHGIKEPIRVMFELTNLNNKPVKIFAAKNVDGKIIGTEAMRFFVEKLAYPAEEYSRVSLMPKLKMKQEDNN